MRKLSEMSEEEILVEALRAVPEYRERIRDTHRFVVEDCLRSSLNRIEAMFRAERKQHKQKLPEQDRKDLDVLLGYFRPKLKDEISRIQTEYMRQRMVSNINATTAQQLLPQAFAKEGLRALVEGQTHRAKVEILVAPTMKLKFYVRYRDLNSKKDIVDNVVRAVLDLKDAVTRLGSSVMVTKR